LSTGKQLVKLNRMGHAMESQPAEIHLCTRCFYPRTGLTHDTPCPECGAPHEVGAIAMVSYPSGFAFGSPWVILLCFVVVFGQFMAFAWFFRLQVMKVDSVAQQACGFAGALVCCLALRWADRHWHRYLVLGSTGVSLRYPPEHARTAGLVTYLLTLGASASAVLFFAASALYMVLVIVVIHTVGWILVEPMRRRMLGQKVEVPWTHIGLIEVQSMNSRASANRRVRLSVQRVRKGRFRVSDHPDLTCWVELSPGTIPLERLEAILQSRTKYGRVRLK
jgi:hypothetical protein